jgi:hypothetical protein
VSPAGSAVRWIVLLSQLSQVVGSIDVSPGEVSWDVIDWGQRLSHVSFNIWVGWHSARIVIVNVFERVYNHSKYESKDS